MNLTAIENGVDADTDADTDTYELTLRQREAQRSLILGAVVMLIGAGLLVAWVKVYEAVAAEIESGRVRTGLLGGGLLFVVSGGATVVSGLRKRAEASVFAGRLRAGQKT